MKLKVHYESNLIAIQQLDEEDWIKSTLYNFSFEIYIYMQISKLYEMYYFVTNIVIHSKFSMFVGFLEGIN
jgi:hypothetical protein